MMDAGDVWRRLDTVSSGGPETGNSHSNGFEPGDRLEVNNQLRECLDEAVDTIGNGRSLNRTENNSGFIDQACLDCRATNIQSDEVHRGMSLAFKKTLSQRERVG